MSAYCPHSSVFCRIAPKVYGVIFLFLLTPAIAHGASGLFYACGADAGTCGTGLVCVKGECLGGNGYITDDPDGCSPELTWKDNRCIIDITSHGEQLGLGETTRDLRDNIRVFLNVLLGFLGVIAVIVIMYAGFTWMTSFGNPERVTKAKKTILWSVAGILVIGSSWTIASYVLSLGKKGVGVIATPGGGGGGDGGIPGTGGVAEQFALDDVETGRPDPDINLPNENVYLCSAIQARFNHAVDAQSFTDSALGLLIKQKVLGSTEDIATWDDAVFQGKLWTQSGQYITFEHFGEENNFAKNIEYAAIYPLTLKDTAQFPLAVCSAVGCEVQSDKIVWRFTTGDKSDPDAPDINISGTYPKAFSDTDPSYPSRGVSARPTLVIAFNEPILASSVVETREVSYTLPDDKGNPKEAKEMRTVPLGEVFEIGAVSAEGIGTAVLNNTLLSVAKIDVEHWLARFEDYGYGSRLVLQLGLEEKNFSPNGWYQIKISGVKDLCGNTFIGERHFHFQVSGAVPRLDGTPPNNLTKVCYQNIAIGVVSNISMYDVVKDSCSVGTGTGKNGFVTEGALVPLSGRTLKVMDDLPANPDERKLITNYDQYCRSYFFEPKSAALSPGQKYQGEVKTRFPVDDKGTLLNSVWSFTTAALNEQCVYPPILKSVSPNVGGKGQCIGITGEHINYFAKDAIRTDTAGAKERIELQKVNPDKSTETCANISAYIDKNSPVRWKDTEVLTKIQEGLTPELPAECVGETFRIVEHIDDDANGLDFLSTAVDLTLTDGAVGPCLEEIRPLKNVFRGDTVTLLGSDFGTSLGSVVYFSNQTDAILTADKWKDAEIKSDVPFPATTGDVYVVNATGVRSNGKTLALSALQPVVVHERKDCAPYVSPNPYPSDKGGGLACILGEGDGQYIPVFIEFTKDITGSGSAFLDPSAYTVYPEGTCLGFDIGSPQCIKGEFRNFSARRFIPDPKKPDDIHSAVEFQVKPKGDSYRIDVLPIIDDKEIATPADFKGYSWMFMASAEDEACKKVDKVNVLLDPGAVQVHNVSTATATAHNEQCQSFASSEFAWSADQPYLQNAQTPDVWEKVIGGETIVKFSNPLNKERYSTVQSVNSSYSEARADIQATVTKTDGENPVFVNDEPSRGIGTGTLIIRNSAYCTTDDDCAKQCSGAPKGAAICDTEDHQCNPVVKSVSPSSAGESEWVTVQGCYFGEAPGEKGRVSFIQGDIKKIGGLGIASIPECSKDKIWSDTQIITIIPKGLENKGAQVEVTTTAERTSNLFNGFTITNKNTRPMLCAIDKESGGVNEEIIVYGEGLNLEGKHEVAFKNIAIGATLTTPAVPVTPEGDPPLVTKANTNVPSDAENGRHEVRYRVGGFPESNPLQFQVNDEGRAAVIKVFPEPNTKQCGKDGVVCDSPQDLSGMGFVEFDKEIFCDSSTLTDCIVVLQNGKPVPGLGYAVEVGGRGFLFNTFEGTARLQVQGSYIARLYQSKINSNKKTASCGIIPVADAEQGICAWTFTITNQIIPKTVTITPSIGEDGKPEDGIIILTPNHPSRDIDAREIFVAKVLDKNQNDITDLVSISWAYEGHDALKEVSSFGSSLTLEAIQNKLGTFRITAQAGDATSEPFPLKIVNDATLKISGYHPQGESVCRNAAVDVLFNKPIDPKTVNAMNAMLLKQGKGDCFTAANAGDNFLRNFALRVKKMFSIFTIYGADDGFTQCEYQETEAEEIKFQFDNQSQPTRITITGDGKDLLSPGATYQLRVFGGEAGVRAKDGNSLWATSPAGCGAVGLALGVDERQRQYCSFVFTAKSDAEENKGICSVERVAVIHTAPEAELNIFKKTQAETIAAQAYADASFKSPINPSLDYDWEFTNWRIEPDSGIMELSVEKTIVAKQVDIKPVIQDDKGNIKTGEGLVRVNVINKANTNNLPPPSKATITPLLVKVTPCEGGGDMFWKFTDDFGNFEFSYCQKPDQSSNILPRLQAKPVPVSSISSRGVLDEYFFVYENDMNFDADSANDRLLVRIFPAANYFISTDGRLPIERWFSDNEESLFEAKSPASPHDPVDGYDSLKTVSAVYVHALNVKENKIYSNVYVLAVTEGASKKTEAVLNQLVANWKFNRNIADPEKIAQLKNDYQRIRQLGLLGSQLALYRALLGSSPAISDSRKPGIAVSIWDKEWRADYADALVHLGAALEQGLKTAISLPLDPLDKPNTAPMACLAETDNIALKTLGLGVNSDGSDDAVELFTCYDDEANDSKGEYYCRGGNPSAYQYVKDQSGSFTLYGNLEYTELASAWCGGRDQYACTGWTGGEASFCQWIKGTGCRLLSVTQPECSKELPYEGSQRTKPFNIMFRPL